MAKFKVGDRVVYTWEAHLILQRLLENGMNLRDTSYLWILERLGKLQKDICRCINWMTRKY
jgi:hypothetical protein